MVSQTSLCGVSVEHAGWYCRFTNLRWLCLEDNCIRKLKGVQGLVHIEELCIARNLLSRISDDLSSLAMSLRR